MPPSRPAPGPTPSDLSQQLRSLIRIQNDFFWRRNEVEARIDALREAPAALRFLSIEPLLEDLGEINLQGIGWVIVGGMSLGTLLTVFVVPTMYLLFARTKVPGANHAVAEEQGHPELVAK